MRDGHAQRGARDAIAHSVDLLNAANLADLGHRRQIAFADIVVHADIGIGRIGVDPRHHEQRKALIHDPFDQRILRLKVHHIVFVDPRRKDQQRGFIHRFRRRLELDQLNHPVAEHHRTGGGGNVFTQGKGGRVRQRGQHLAVMGLDIGDKVLQPLHQAFAIGGNRLFQSIRVGAQKIGRRQHVDDLAGEILHALFVGRRNVLHIADGGVNGLRVDEVLLLEIVEGGVGIPQRVRETAILGAGIGGGLEFTRGQRLLGLDIMRQRFAPIADLMLQHLGGVLQHGGQIGLRGLHVDVRRRPIECGIFLLLARQGRHQPLRQPFDFREVGLHPL